MMGAYPDGDVARASLAQMNEISRRAEVAGMSFGVSAGTGAGAGASGSANANVSARQAQGQSQGQGQGQGHAGSSMSRIMAAAAGLGVEAPVRPMSRQDALARIEELSRQRPASAQGQASSSQPTLAQQQQQSQSQGGSTSADGFSSDGFLLGGAGGGGYAPGSVAMTHEGLQVFTVGHLMPRSTLEDENGNWAFDAATLNAVVMPTPQGMGGDPEGEDEGTKGPYTLAAASTSAERYDPVASGSGAASGSGGPGRPGSAQKLRVRRSAYVPGWAVPPRVLLVDDDAVSRRLSSKFLQVFGCTIDVAVDGVGAVNKMNLEKYDLVLMVGVVLLSPLRFGAERYAMRRILSCRSSTVSPRRHSSASSTT